MASLEQAAAAMKHRQLFEEALSAHRAGHLDLAEEKYSQLLALVPEHFLANHHLGIVRMQCADFAGAIPILRRASFLNPGDFGCHSNLANALFEVGDFASALESFDRALAIDSKVVAFRLGRANTLLELGRADEAVAEFKLAIELDPGNFACYNDLGNALTRMGRAAEAVDPLQRAVQLAPRAALPLSNLGNAFLSMQRPARALEVCQRALTLDPKFSDALYNSGCASLDMDRFVEARQYFERNLAVAPNSVKTLVNLGIVYKLLRMFEESARSVRRALELSPEHPYLLGFLLASLRGACRWRESEAVEAAMLAKLNQGHTAAHPSELTLFCDSPALLLACARQHAQREFGSIPMSPRFSAFASKRLKIGYLSSDFHNHATMQLMAEFFERHDRSRFEVIAFSSGRSDGSPMRRRVESAFERFVDVSEFPDAAMAEQIQRSEIQLLVDLKGLTMGNRLRVLARRCAPLQVTYLGFPGTTGTNFIDYLIADPVVVPEEHRCFYSEQLVYLPNSYQVNDTQRRIADTPSRRAEVDLPEHAFVYCCLNASYKISAALFAAWMRILKAVPHGVLWLLKDNDAAARNLRAAAQEHGIADHRLIFAPRAPTAEHIARYRLADLFLDTLPCGAHTTASEALWAGLPVLTCLGKSFAGRVGASLARAAELPELVVGSMAVYEASAIQLARDRSLLSVLRDRLVRNQRALPLFDTASFTRVMESAYESMWQRHASGLAPASFHVQAKSRASTEVS